MFRAPQQPHGGMRLPTLAALGGDATRLVLLGAVLLVVICGCLGVTLYRGVLGNNNAGLPPVATLAPLPPAATSVDGGAPGGLQLAAPVLAASLGAGNRPVGVMTSFPANSQIVYVVTQVTHVPAGSQFFARWMLEGRPFEDSAALTAGHAYTATYVEFHLQPKPGLSLPAGSWTVQIFANGAAGPRAPFTLR